MKPQTRPPSRRTFPAAVLTLGLVLGAAACTGDDDPGADPGESVPAQPTDDGSSFEIETRATLGRVVGRLGKEQRRQLPDTVAAVVQDWFDAAYVGGDWPRSDFSDAYPGFTPRAADEARRDKRLMTNVGIGDRVEAVVPTSSRVWVDVLAVRQRPVGVTARFLLKFRTEGDYERKVRVKGALRLTEIDGDWRIFAYDVARGARA